MGLTWALGWALAGVLIGVSSVLLPGLPWDAFFRVFDAPLPALAVPGFIGGVIFSTVLGIAGRGRRFRELSLSRFTAWGAVAGALLSLVPAAAVGAGLATYNGPDAMGLWITTAAFASPLTLLSAASAAGTLVLARMAEDRGLVDDGADEALAEGEAQELLGGGQ